MTDLIMTVLAQNRQIKSVIKLGAKYLITSNYSSQFINYLNVIIVYISKQFNQKQPISWHGFKRFIQIALVGKKGVLRVT